MKLEVEWLDAPGVGDRVLAATWARLKITAGDGEVTELLHLASDTRRPGVYGSVFPLAEWLAENWWQLLHEPARTRPIRPAREVPAWQRAWYRRHNLLAAREGGALPDATIVRDGADIHLHWFPDAGTETLRQVRFVGAGRATMAASTFEDEASRFVQAVLGRLAATLDGEPDEDVQRLASGWEAIRTATTDERRLCRALALLGLDPYDPDEAPEDLIERVEGALEGLPQSLADDLLEGIRPDGLAEALAWLETQRARLDGSLEPVPGLPTDDWAPSAHEVGYRLARQLRTDRLGLSEREPISDLSGLLVDRLGWDPDPVRAVDPVASLEGLVGPSVSTGRPVLVDPGRRKGWAERFLLARGTFFLATERLDRGRLLTTAVTPDQRAGRAFAAELLAPAAALAAKVSGTVTEDQLADLSESFGVNPLLIEHQLENHGIGAVAAA